METAVGTHPFAHRSEAEFAEILDFYGIRWEYEATAFPLTHDTDGRVASRFAPDFYLPDVKLWVEITTIRQALMRQKRRKLRRVGLLGPLGQRHRHESVGRELERRPHEQRTKQQPA